ncbi:MAG: hypothetical protein M3Y39_22855, partial [Chloroflexota bacterium]|nr:hypothetical protein [Chloroflexota bacterium]
MLKINSFPVRTPTKDKLSTALSPIPLVFVGLAILALLLGIASSIIGSYVLAIVIGACIMAIVLFLRQDEWAVTLLLVIHLYV